MTDNLERYNLIEQRRLLGEPIWSDLFLVRMAYRDTLGEEHIREFGMPTTGVDELDKQIRNEKVTCMITIDAMAEHFRAGRVVSVAQYSDLEAIYDIIDRYLSCWAKLLHGAINLGDAPIDDLLLLDAMATRLYEHSKTFGGMKLKQKSKAASFFGAKLMNFSREALMGGGPEEPQSAANTDVHQSYAPLFLKHLKPASTNQLKDAEAMMDGRRRHSWK